ncbi:MAG: hypothetical protein Q9223_004899, partial [Gallowayella weberi]
TFRCRPQPWFHWRLARSAGSGLYCASKAAIAVFTESLRKEVQSLGIEVTAIGPGYVRTNFLSSGHHKSRAANVIVDYKSSIKDNMAGLAAYNRKQTGDPAKRAQIIVKALTKTGHSQGKELPAKLALGNDLSTTLLESWMPTVGISTSGRI